MQGPPGAPAAAASHEAAARAARECYGKILSYLAFRWRDLSAAEDALGEAFAIALEKWPHSGIPQQPEAWLLTTARNRLVDDVRRREFLQLPEVLAVLQAAQDEAMQATPLPDERLAMLLLCTHPSIDAAVRPALMLQTVLGVEVKAMAGAFLLPPDTLNKRLVRAKQRLRAAGVRLVEPPPAELPQRLHSVLESVYAAYFLGCEGLISDGDGPDELRSEALYLAELACLQLPRSAEALGLHALVLFCEARRPAQVSGAGEFVPLEQQDVGRWNRPLLEAAYRLLAAASKMGEPGPFQLEAAIHGAHCYRAHSGSTPWREIACLYDTLVQAQPTLGARVARAVAHAHADGDLAAALAMLDAIDSRQVQGYQSWWVARAHLLGLAGQTAAARDCLSRALGLTSHPRLHAFLLKQLESGCDWAGHRP